MTNFKPDNHSEMDYTQKALGDGELKKAVQRSGRPLIDRSTKVLEGVYGGNYGLELISVDYKKHRETYERLVSQVEQLATVEEPDHQGLGHTSRIDKDLILESVLKITQDTLPYSLEATDNIFKAQGGRDYTEIPLSRYINEQAGVCRHQALLAATLLEILKAKGVIGGTARVNRSQQWPEEGDPSGHAWVRYTNSAGEVWIIDPAQNYVGSLEEAIYRENGWNYSIPGEDDVLRDQVTAQRVADTGVVDGVISSLPSHLKEPPLIVS